MICMNRDRRSFLLSSVAAPFVQTRKRSTTRPNLVLFMTDDHGAWATGAYGARGILPPHIDRLANSGARFTRAFAATPVCSPSRMTWMTGCLPATHRVEDWLLPEDSFGPKSRDWLDGLLTWPEVLKAHGYTMAMCGKWHMGRDDRAQRGFTEWATVPGGSGTYRNPTFVHNGRPQPIQGFKEDALGDFALDFLAQQKNGHNFALLMPFYAPHTPFDFTPDRYRAAYRDSAFPDFPDTPVHAAQNPQLQSMHGNRDAKLGYSSLVTAADANIGDQSVMTVTPDHHAILIYPVGPGQSKRIPMPGYMVHSAGLFPDVKRVWFTGSEAGRGPRSYITDLSGEIGRAHV